MTIEVSPAAPAAESAPKWKPLNSRQRRVLGVLVEKAKTVPESYPMTLNGIVTGCNQKSNREPQLTLSPEEVEQALEELRALGVVTEVQGQGRVAKFRHHAYEWLGVSAVELAVMTELLLRGEQSLGDLRGRAARMEAIADLNALKPVVDGLVSRALVVELTSAGRGQIITHGIYKERELVELRARFAGHVPAALGDDEPSSPARSAANGNASIARYATADSVAELAVDVAELRAEIARLRTEVQRLTGSSPPHSTI